MMGWKAYVMHAAADKSVYQLPKEHPMRKMMEPFLLGNVPYGEYVIESGTHWGEWAEPDGVLVHTVHFAGIGRPWLCGYRLQDVGK